MGCVVQLKESWGHVALSVIIVRKVPGWSARAENIPLVLRIRLPCFENFVGTGPPHSICIVECIKSMHSNAFTLFESPGVLVLDSRV